MGRAPSKKAVLRIRQELDNYILGKGWPLASTGLFNLPTGGCLAPLSTLPIPHVNNGIKSAAPGTGYRIPIDQDIANALKLYATTLCKYLVTNGIPAVVDYDSKLYRRSKYVILFNDSAWYVSHYMLDIYTSGGRGPTIWVGMSTDQYVAVEYEVSSKLLGSQSNTTYLDNLISYLRPLIDRLEGDFLCKECHYSAYGDGDRFCGRGLMPAPKCSGYRNINH